MAVFQDAATASVQVLNDYATSATNDGDVVVFTSLTRPLTITGLATSQFDAGDKLHVLNASPFPIYLKNQSSLTTGASKRIVTPGGSDYTVRPGGGVCLIKAANAGGSVRWHVVA